MQNKEFIWVYPYSQKTAKEQGQMELYVASFRENARCSDAIETAIRDNFDGTTLAENTAQEVIAQFGFHRVQYVLANTVQELYHDGRVSSDNKKWARDFSFPSTLDRRELRITSHPGVLDGFINQTRQAYQALGLYDAKHCCQDSYMQDFTNKVVVLSATALKADRLSLENQLWLAEDGFGCRPEAMGNAVYATCLATGQRERLERYQLCGVLESEHMPDWATAKVSQLTQPAPSQTMGGQSM